MINFVDVETPYSAKDLAGVRKNILYARACVRDCLLRSEVPFASHLLYTQLWILDDTLPRERELGIHAGKKLITSLPGIVTVVYQDLGISKGMEYGIFLARQQQRSIEYRNLEKGWLERELAKAASHPHATVWGANLLGR